MALQDKKIIPPPWLAFPEIERYSIGWRMFYGENYIDRNGVALVEMRAME